MKTTWIKAVFWASAVYDFVLGVIFLFAAGKVFAHFEVTPPNHPGYVQFPALVLIVFAALFARVATDPVRYRALMPYGMGLKLAYSGVVLWHAATEAGVPAMWLPFAYIDLVFLVLFLMAWRVTGKGRG